MSHYEGYDYRYITCNQIVRHGVGYRDTLEYSIYLEKLANGLPARGMSTVKEVNDYMRFLEDFYREVNLSRQLKSQRQLGGSSFCGEINFVVGRNGELLKADDGNHRFAVARACELQAIPIQVSMIHPQLIEPLIRGMSISSAVKTVNEYLLEVESRYA